MPSFQIYHFSPQRTFTLARIPLLHFLESFMNKKSVFRWGFNRTTLLLALAASTQAVHAALPTLSFDVAANVSQNKTTTQAMSSHVFLKGELARLESRAGDQKIVVLWRKPYVYRLLPSTKSGVRFKASTPSMEMAGLASNWPQLMNNPSSIRATLAAKGAKKIAATKLGGVAAELYAAKNWQGQNALSNVKIWLRRSDSLPLQMTGKADAFNVLIRWSNYRRNVALSDSLFQVPKGYRVREVKSPQAAS